MAREFHVDIALVGGRTVTGVPNPTASDHVANKAYVDGAIENISWKDAVRAASTGNVTLSGPGAAIDGVTLTSGDRVLLKNQTTGSENGIYIFTGAATPLTRAPDATTFAELEAAVVGVEEGTTQNGTWWRQSAVNGVIDTDTVSWGTFMSGAPSASESTAGIAEVATQTEVDAGSDDARFVTPAKLRAAKGTFTKPFAQTIGDGSTLSFNIDHNLNTRDVHVAVYKMSGNYDEIMVDVQRPTVNRVTVVFGTGNAPATNGVRVVVIGMPTA